MPKQVIKLEQFHGGLSTNSDPRDVAVNELTAAIDVMVDELGKIRTLGGTDNHVSTPSTAIDIEAGYGLFQFSHDRINGHLGEHLDETDFATHANWDVTGDVSDTSVAGQLTFTFTTGTLEGTAQQVYGDRLEAGIAGIEYAFTYTVTVTTAPDAFALTLDNFPASSTTLPFTAGTHTVTFTSHANAATVAFTITATDDQSGTTSQGVFSIDNVSLRIYDPAETGDDYLVLADDESSDPAVYMYSKNENAWSESQTITVGTTNSFAPCFYTVDGALRISDGNFGSANSNKWYGYIGRELFSDIVPSYDINQWYEASQKVSAPNKSTWDDNVTFAAGFGGTSTQAGDGTTDQDVLIAENTLDNDCVNVIKAEVTYRYRVEIPGSTVQITFEVGTYTSAFLVSQVNIFRQTNVEAGIYTGVLTFYFDATDTATDVNGGTAYDSFNAHITSASGVSTQGITNLVCYESGTSPDHSSRLSNNNIHIDFDWETATGASGWNNAGNTGEWKVGVSFIYDGIQESQITTLVDAADDSVTSFVVPGSLGITAAPSIRLFIADFQTVSTAWNKRITGCNIYMQDVAQDITQPWFLQLSADFENGKLKVENSQKEYDARYYAEATQEYYYWELGEGDPPDESVMLVPANVITYGINSGLLEDEKSVLSKYKTAVVVGRIVYIGGLEFQNEDGSTEVRGDAMIKSPVNKFDLFPLSRLIEVSVQDGDNIVKLEEYADRILQFKKNKMHLINVSQELEFLEDTFVHKGVSHPAATCKTDFGIAWVNKLGCYLYDGQKVTNLLEKGGRQIIKESEWATFTANEPMIGYVPKKRQLIVVDDITTADGTNDGECYIYDLVTQSWVQGSAATFDDQKKTNFVTDWSGDLVHAHTNGTVLKWKDTSTASTAFGLNTKDIDFGQPSQRKKIYKAYVSYKGDGDSVTVQYAVNGDTDTVAPFYRTTADGSSDKSNSDTTPLLDSDTDDWISAELRPVSSINNVKSFQLQFGGTAEADFEINDISIVYRLKNIK
jgi:hypothetical protein